MSTALKGVGLALARHESVIALLKAFPQECDPKSIIRKLARSKVAVAKSYGWSGPAFCPKILASLFDIRCKQVDIEIGGDGRILPYPDGKLWIEYRSKRMLERQRFTIFHEFAHTLFPDFCDFLPHHHVPFGRYKEPDKEFENLCDIAASEMLLPVENAMEDLARMTEVCLEQFERLSRRYEASFDATAHRFTELIDTVPCATVFLTDQKGTHPGRGPLWVKYCCRNALFKGFIPPGATPPVFSVAIGCYRDGERITQPTRETWWLNRQPRTWLCQAVKLPEIPDSPDYSKVAVLLLPSGYRRV
jgi:IrrE N-terminal-like domain